MPDFNYSTYLSPFTMRYGSDQMRQIFSEQNKFLSWRKIWVALAQVQYQAGLLTKSELNDLVKNETNIDSSRILEIEKDTRHDVVAAIREFSEKAKTGGGKIHLGATSMDIVDNADTLKIKQALQLIEAKLKTVLSLFSQKITKYIDLPCIGYTHLQPAEPTTVGYRLALYAQDLLINLDQIKLISKNLKAKGIKGAVGTSASFQALLKGKAMTAAMLEKKVMQILGLEALLISNQTYTRQIDYSVLNCLAGISSSLAKFAGDLRILQSSNFGEWSEPFGKKQVGSSAMPFKKNPISSENICSLARFVIKLPEVALENQMLSYLERTLDDSANRRLILAESFLATEQILMTAEKILSGLVINEKRIAYNLNQYAPFAATEGVLITLVKKGANRQEMHEVLRNISMIAWQDIQEGKVNPMKDLLINNPQIKKYLSQEKLTQLFNIENHLGDAPQRAKILTKKIHQAIKHEKK